jgi:two-component system, cell cycle sensor histidine kinase and response regulator CckA
MSIVAALLELQPCAIRDPPFSEPWSDSLSSPSGHSDEAACLPPRLGRSAEVGDPNRRDRIERALGRTAERLLLGDIALPAVLSDFVSELGVACGVSRAYVFRHQRDSSGTVGVPIAQWSASVAWRVAGAQPSSYESLGVAHWVDRLARGEIVSANESDGPSTERDFLASRGIKTLLCVPVFADGGLWGVIGVDDGVSVRPPRIDELEALVAAARLIGAAIHRRTLDERVTSQARALRASDALHRTLVRHFPNGSVSLVDRDLRFVVVDGQGFRDFGIDPAGMIGKTIFEALTPEIVRQDEPLYRAALRGHDANARVTLADRTFDVRVVPVRDDAGEVTHALSLVSDVTTQVHAETALREHQERMLRTQKIEALGRLAGGIAHDFNNLLTVIGTSAELALETLDPTDAVATDLAEVQRAAERGYLLTRQLLAFTRQQPSTEPRLLSVNEVVTSALSMLQRVGGTPRPIGLELADAAGAIYADRGQIEQVLVNLVVNAIDATADGGTITVSTLRVPATPFGFDCNDAVLLRVRDSGTGMDLDTQAKIFEPFFTTKPIGRGTGLGLATVFAIVQQSGGSVSVDSVPGRGTTFTVALPRRGSEADVIPDEAPRRADAHFADETVLVVDDEMAVRASLRRLLVSHGYRVLEAKDGLDALSELERHRTSVALVLTDIVMPDLDGPGLADRIRHDVPGLPIVFMTGYARDLLTQSGAASANTEVPLIEKPFSGRELLRVIRSRIDGTDGPIPRSA